MLLLKMLYARFLAWVCFNLFGLEPQDKFYWSIEIHIGFDIAILLILVPLDPYGAKKYKNLRKLVNVNFN